MIDLKKIHEIGLLLKNSIDESKIYKTIFNVVSKPVQFDFGTLFINTNENELTPIYSINEVVVDLASDFSIGNGSGIAGWVSNNDNPVVFPNFMNNNPTRKFSSFVSIPLIIDEKRIGVMNLGHKDQNHFKEDDVVNFGLIGNQIAIILDKLNLKKEMNSLNLKLDNTLKELNETQENLNQKEKIAIISEDVMFLNKEINNPLSVIMGFSDLLLNKCKNGNIEPEIIIDKLEIILDSARKINTIIHHFENTQIKN